MMRDHAAAGGSPAAFMQTYSARAYDPPPGVVRDASLDPRIAALPPQLPPTRSALTSHLSYTSFAESVHLIVNELTPEGALPILSRAPRGVYLAIGGERAFVDFSLASNPAGLIVTDCDPNVIRFCQFNRTLLRIAVDQQQYRYLRFEASLEEVLAAADRRSLPESDRALLTPDQWQWWSQYVRRAKGIGTIDFHQGTRRKSLGASSWRGNYLFDRSAFDRVQSAVCFDAVRCYLLNWRDDDSAERIGAALKAAGLMIGVFDVSNAWQDRYIGAERVIDAAREWLQVGVAQPASMVVGTAGSTSFSHRRWSMSSYPGYPLSYQGWTFQHLAGDGATPLQGREFFGGGPFNDYPFDESVAE